MPCPARALFSDPSSSASCCLGRWLPTPAWAQFLIAPRTRSPSPTEAKAWPDSDDAVGWTRRAGATLLGSLAGGRHLCVATVCYFDGCSPYVSFVVALTCHCRCYCSSSERPKISLRALWTVHWTCAPLGSSSSTSASPTGAPSPGSPCRSERVGSGSASSLPLGLSTFGAFKNGRGTTSFPRVSIAALPPVASAMPTTYPASDADVRSATSATETPEDFADAAATAAAQDSRNIRRWDSLSSSCHSDDETLYMGPGPGPASPPLDVPSTSDDSPAGTGPAAKKRKSGESELSDSRESPPDSKPPVTAG